MPDSTQAYNEFQWNSDIVVAMLLIMEGRLTDEQIGDRCGFSEATLMAWRCHPEFQAAYDKCRKHFGHLPTKDGMANRNRRIAQLGERWERFVTICGARSKDPETQNAPGDQTGLMGKTHRVSETYEAVEYFMDAASIRDQRAMAEQTAKDLVDWAKKLEITDVDGKYPIELLDKIIRDAERGLEPDDLEPGDDNDP